MFESYCDPELVKLMWTEIAPQRWVSTGRWCPYGRYGPGTLESFVRVGVFTKMIQYGFHDIDSAFKAHLELVEKVRNNDLYTI